LDSVELRILRYRSEQVSSFGFVFSISRANELVPTG